MNQEVVDLAILVVKERGVRCKFLTTGEAVTLKPRHQLWKEVPGQILTVRPNKLWNYAGTRYLSGEVLSTRTEVEKLNLVPLRLEARGIWDPSEAYWGEPGVDPYQLKVIEAGPRDCFEMEQVIPGDDDENTGDDPILEASEYYQCGEEERANKIMARLLSEDLRCIDAHAHLGNWEFARETSYDDFVKRALFHYDIGIRIGKLSLPADFHGLLPWGLINNRPFLRCMHGYGLCHWRLGDLKSARETFARIMWLNPVDNQGIRFGLRAIDEGVSWEDFKD